MLDPVMTAPLAAVALNSPLMLSLPDRHSPIVSRPIAVRIPLVGGAAGACVYRFAEPQDSSPGKLLASQCRLLREERRLRRAL